MHILYYQIVVFFQPHLPGFPDQADHSLTIVWRHTNHTKFRIWSCHDQLGIHLWSRLWSTWSHEWSRLWLTCYHKWTRLWLAWNHKWTRLWLARNHKWTRQWLARNHKWTRLWSACNHKHVWPDYDQPWIMPYLLWQNMISLFLYGRSTRVDYRIFPRFNSAPSVIATSGNTCCYGFPPIRLFQTSQLSNLR